MDFGSDLPVVSDADWAATPASVRALVAALVARLQAQDAALRALRAEVADLRERLDTHAGNSSKPPSSDPPGTPRTPTKPSRRTRGAQKGHRRAMRPLVPRERVDRVVVCKPAACVRCGEDLVGDDPAPWRHQVIELATKLVDVTEYEVHRLTCTGCGATGRGDLPADAERTGYGERFTALMAVLATRFKGSTRDRAALATTVFGAHVATGTVCKLEQRVSAALAAPVAAAHAAAQRAPVAHADETGWREAKRRAWVWLLATQAATIVAIAARRGTAAARALLGDFAGILVTDRWVAYDHVPTTRRQVCWAHLRREWQRFVDRGGASAGRDYRRVTCLASVEGGWLAVDETAPVGEFAVAHDELGRVLRRAQWDR